MTATRLIGGPVGGASVEWPCAGPVLPVTEQCVCTDEILRRGSYRRYDLAPATAMWEGWK